MHDFAISCVLLSENTQESQPLPSDAPPALSTAPHASSEASPPPPEPAQPEEPTPEEDLEEGEEEGGSVADDDDIEELERLAQKKLEILKAIDIELPDTVVSYLRLYDTVVSYLRLYDTVGSNQATLSCIDDEIIVKRLTI